MIYDMKHQTKAASFYLYLDIRYSCCVPRYKGKKGRAPSTNLVEAGTALAERLQQRAGRRSAYGPVEKVTNMMAVSNIHLQVRGGWGGWDKLGEGCVVEGLGGVGTALYLRWPI